MYSNGLPLDLTLKLGADAEFDRMIAAAVYFAEDRLQEGLSAGEIELELISRGVDGQVVISTRPILEALHEHEVAKRGFTSWRRHRPETSMTGKVAEYIAYYSAFGLIVALFFLFAIQLRDLSLDSEMVFFGVLGLASVVAIPLRRVSEYGLYLVFRTYWKLRVALYRWKLGNIPDLRGFSLGS